MSDIVLDTNVLADFLAQFLSSESRITPTFCEDGFISAELAQIMNRIVRWWEDLYIDQYPGHLVASTLAFVEMSRKWEHIVRGRFEVIQVAAFIEQPPEWFIVEPLNEALVVALCDVPAYVGMPQGSIRSLEWTDAVHVATAFARGKDARLAASDREMRRVVESRITLCNQMWIVTYRSRR